MCNRKMYITTHAKYDASFFLFVLSCKEAFLKNRNISFEDVLYILQQQLTITTARTICGLRRISSVVGNSVNVFRHKFNSPYKFKDCIQNDRCFISHSLKSSRSRMQADMTSHQTFDPCVLEHIFSEFVNFLLRKLLSNKGLLQGK